MKKAGQAWTYQKAADIENLGEAFTPWYVGWYEPDGRRKAKNTGVIDDAENVQHVPDFLKPAAPAQRQA